MNKFFLTQAKTDLPVLKPFVLDARPGWQSGNLVTLASNRNVGFVMALVLIVWLLLDSAIAQTQGDPNQTIFQTLIKWTPLMFKGP
ncbi:MAG: hypothetical protein GY761_13070, partial [Hyphomicrobiales bacterium]|nr:hypothetical protein [Hyphomicrobiales bacterium]